MEEQESQEQLKRKPAKEVLLGELKNESGRVAVLGEIISFSKDTSECIISDDQEKAKLVFQDSKQLDSLREKELYRVIGKTVFNSNLPTINVETIQGMHGFDLDLWKKVRGIEAKPND